MLDLARTEAEDKLREVFNLPYFKERQWEVLEKIFQGSKVLLIEKTGFGKSLCFQFPSLYFNGIVLVFSPLIALMRDQVINLKARGIRAECINSENTTDENERIINQASNNQLDMLYVAPERQESHNWELLLEKITISMIVIDEAHCISVWGHDFRPSYKKLVKTISKIPNVPILGTTATATRITEEDIAHQIGDHIDIIRGSLDRVNLKLHSIKTDSLNDKLSLLVQILRQVEGCSIVFAGTHSETEFISNVLNYCGIRSVYYHAGVMNREKIEQEVLQDEWECIVATNSFGMGIDKKDFRAIVHTRFPSSPIHYYQEIGRAGRDDKISEIFLLWDPSDIQLQNYFIEESKPSFEKYYAVIDFIKDNPDSSPYDISYQLDFSSTMVENILVDLETQKIVIKYVEILEKSPEYAIYDKYQLQEIRDTLEENLSSLDNSIDASTVEKLLTHLANNSSSEYTLAKEIFGRRTNFNRQLIIKMLTTIIDYQKSHGKTFIETNKRFERTTTYKINDQGPPLNESQILKIRNNKLSQLKKMQEYLKYSHCRMKFLCNYLGDNLHDDCGICDYCILELNKTGSDSEERWAQLLDLCVYNRNSMFVTTTCGKCDSCKKIDEFYKKEYPYIILVYPSEVNMPIEERKLKLLDALAVTYEFTKSGERILLEGEVNGQYSEATATEVYRLYQTRFTDKDFDIILSCPSSKNGLELMQLANKLGNKTGLPVSSNLITNRDIEPEPSIKTWQRKVDNVKDAFMFENPKEIAEKSILLICDTFYSKAMIREIGKYLSKLKVKMIQPIFLVKIFE